jgi:predicted alpha/beta superfamily hydrolase
MESKSYQIIYMLDGAKIIMFDQADDAVMFRLAWL